MTTSTPKRPPARPWRFSLSDPRVAGLFWQVLVVAVAVAVIAFLWSNAVHNLSVRRISTGFAFLGREAGMPIADSWIDYTPKDTYLRAFIVGVVNTLRVAVIGIVLATVIGTLVGIARLSSNWLLARLAAVYVEVLRDLPLLLQLLFWYVLMQGLPAARQAFKPVEGVFLSNRGLILPSVPLSASNWWTILALVAGLTVFTIVRRRLIAQQMLDGNARPAWPYALGLIVALPALVSFLAGASWRIVLPELRGFNFVGGLTLAPEYFALLIALVTYTSAFIAEIVRSGLAHVPEGREVFPLLSVRDNLMMGAYTRQDRDAVAADMALVYSYFPILRERAAQDAGLLSGGQQQMLAISRALMANPDLILLDEPSLGLSPKLTKEIFEIVVRINRERGTTILLVEQNANMALNASDYGYVLENGRIVMEDSCERLREKDDIKEFYLGMKDVGVRGERRWKKKKTWR